MIRLVAYLYARLLGVKARCRGPKGTEVIITKRIFPGWAGAQTIGTTIIVLETQSPAWHLPHELVHVEQWKRLGVLFPLAYLLGSLRALISGRNAYYNNPFEEEARRRAPENKRLVERWRRNYTCR